MKKNCTNRAFTLIEILVAMAVIGVLALGASRFNFNAINNKQSLDREVLQIINIGEEVKNFSLVGKGIGNPLIIPTSWRIIFDRSNGIITAGYSNDDTNYTTYTTWEVGTNRSLRSLTCGNRDMSNTDTGNVIVLKYVGNSSLIESGCSASGISKLIIDYGNAQFSETIMYDLITGIIE